MISQYMKMFVLALLMIGASATQVASASAAQVASASAEPFGEAVERLEASQGEFVWKPETTFEYYPLTADQPERRVLQQDKTDDMVEVDFVCCRRPFCEDHQWCACCLDHQVAGRTLDDYIMQVAAKPNGAEDRGNRRLLKA